MNRSAAASHCHSTNFRAVFYPSGRPEAADHGIGCERCHGPGGHHLQAVRTGFPDLAIGRPRLAPADRVVALCGECHESPEPHLPSDPSLIRFQAPSLVLSRCYTESRSLSCVTCHDPHQNASRTPSHYERASASNVILRHTCRTAAQSGSRGCQGLVPVFYGLGARLPGLPHAPRSECRSQNHIHGSFHPGPQGEPAAHTLNSDGRFAYKPSTRDHCPVTCFQCPDFAA